MIRQLSAPELKALMESGAPFELVDVRTEDERAVATIEGSRLLDQAYHDHLLALDRNTTLVFQCHHGSLVLPQPAGRGLVRRSWRAHEAFEDFNTQSELAKRQ